MSGGSTRWASRSMSSGMRETRSALTSGRNPEAVMAHIVYVGESDGSVGGQDHRARRAHPAAGAADTREPRPRDLPLAALPPELAGRLDQQEDPAHAGVAGGQAAAVGVGG